MESYTKPTNYHNFSNFLKNHQSFPDKKGKSLKDMLVGAKKKGNYYACDFSQSKTEKYFERIIMIIWHSYS